MESDLPIAAAIQAHRLNALQWFTDPGRSNDFRDGFQELVSSDYMRRDMLYTCLTHRNLDAADWLVQHVPNPLLSSDRERLFWACDQLFWDCDRMSGEARNDTAVVQWILMHRPASLGDLAKDPRMPFLDALAAEMGLIEDHNANPVLRLCHRILRGNAPVHADEVQAVLNRDESTDRSLEEESLLRACVEANRMDLMSLGPWHETDWDDVLEMAFHVGSITSIAFLMGDLGLRPMPWSHLVFLTIKHKRVAILDFLAHKCPVEMRTCMSLDAGVREKINDVATLSWIFEHYPNVFNDCDNWIWHCAKAGKWDLFAWTCERVPGVCHTKAAQLVARHAHAGLLKKIAPVISRNYVEIWLFDDVARRAYVQWCDTGHYTALNRMCSPTTCEALGH